MNRLQEIIEAAGGMLAYATRMGGHKHRNVATLTEVSKGMRVPKPETRMRIVAASDGQLTEDDIIAITGRTEAPPTSKFKVDEHWSLESPDLQHWVTTRADKAARKQRLANERERAQGGDA